MYVKGRLGKNMIQNSAIGKTICTEGLVMDEQLCLNERKAYSSTSSQLGASLQRCSDSRLQELRLDDDDKLTGSPRKRE